MNRGLSSLFSLKKTIFALFVFWIGFSPMIIPIVNFTVSSQQSNTASVTVISISSVHTAQAQEQKTQTEQDLAGFSCSGSGFLGIDFYCGFIKVIVTVITVIPNLIAGVIGVITDFVINFSIGHGIYVAAQDIAFGAWKMIRDIANIAIIFSLFIAAFGFILGSDGGDKIKEFVGDPKKIVMKTIFVALMINFSFFFSRVIIDVGNLGARLIYNQIGAEGRSFDQIIFGTGGSSGTIKDKDGKSIEIKNITLTMLDKVQAQSLLSGAKDSGGKTADGKDIDTTTTYLILGFCTLIFDIILITVFITMLVLFLGRIVMLLLYTILSPLAFASLPVPMFSKDKYLGMDAWIKGMFGQSFLAVAFLFFIYLSIIFAGIDIPIADSSGVVGGIGSIVGMLAGIGIKLAMMFFVIFYGKKIATDWSGVVGEYASGIMKTASGFAIGAATGGTALLARQTLGRGGSALANSVSGGGVMSRGIRSFGTKLGSATYDVRNSTGKDGKGGIMGRFNQATNALGGGTIDVGDKYKQAVGKDGKPSGFIAQGTVGQMWDKRAKTIADEKIKKQEAIAKETELNEQSKQAQAVQQQELVVEKANQAKSIAESRIENDANNQIGLSGEAKKQQDIIDAVDNYARLKTDLENKKAATTDPSEITKIDSDIAKLTKTRDDATKDSNKGYDKAKASLATINSVNGKSIREITNEVEKKKIQSENSLEKREMDKAKTDADESKTKANEAETELKNLRKRKEALEEKQNKTPDEQDVIDKMKDQENDLAKVLQDKQAENTKKQAEFKDKEKKFNTAFGDYIKVLTDGVKNTKGDYIKNAKKDPAFIVLENSITDNQVKLQNLKFKQNEENLSRKQNYANSLDSNNPITISDSRFGTKTFSAPNNKFTRAVGVISNGAVFGGQVNNANQQSASSIRNSINGSKK